MTTISKVKKIAKAEFIPEMKALGFEYIAKDTTFYQDVSGIRRVIWIEVTKGGHAFIELFCWVPEINEDSKSALARFPRDVPITNGGRLDTFGISGGGKFWSIQSEEEISTFLQESLDGLKKHIFPWFESIDSREKLLEAMHPDVKEREWFDEMKKDILAAK
jgi:hypothetical protein